MDKYDPIFATREQIREIESLAEKNPAAESMVSSFFEYHRILSVLDLTHSLADDLIQIFKGYKRAPVKEKKRKNPHTN